MILGRVLATLGGFAECATGTLAAVPLASATLELLMAPQVHGHAEPFVRRACLLASGQLLACLPPSAVASALVQQDSSSSALTRRLDWLNGWCRKVMDADMDDNCRMMATACVNIHSGLAAEALQLLEQGQSLQGPQGVVGQMLSLTSGLQQGSLVRGAPGPSAPKPRSLIVELPN
eukprot:gene14088-20040_t